MSTAERMAALKMTRDEADRNMQELARELPPLTMKEVCPDRCNIGDRTIRSNIARFMDRYTRIDTSLLDTDDIDKWELLTGSERYEVREIPDPDDAEGDVPSVVYQVWDTEEREQVGDTFYKEYRADDEARSLNLEHQREHLYGFPFAHTWGWAISRYDVERFEAAGFVVWLYDGFEYIAGIDGGGYSFEGAHYIRVYWDCMSGSVVETDDGYRVLG